MPCSESNSFAESGADSCQCSPRTRAPSCIWLAGGSLNLERCKILSLLLLHGKGCGGPLRAAGQSQISCARLAVKENSWGLARDKGPAQSFVYTVGSAATHRAAQMIDWRDLGMIDRCLHFCCELLQAQELFRTERSFRDLKPGSWVASSLGRRLQNLDLEKGYSKCQNQLKTVLSRFPE